jgi:hypothetical protein
VRYAGIGCFFRDFALFNDRKVCKLFTDSYDPVHELDSNVDPCDQRQTFVEGYKMSLSQRDTDLIFRKRKIAGRNVLTSLERDARLLQGPETNVKRPVASSAAGKKKAAARFVVEKSTGLLRSGK